MYTAADELGHIEKAIEVIDEKAKEAGLDCFPMRFELVPASILYTIGAYGMPTRFAHWSFGKAYHRMKTQYDYNLSRIYELVINTDPCYAFLLEGNSLIQNKLVIAHVYAHCDFFKNNAYFQPSNHQMMDIMAMHARRLHEYEQKYGVREVEIFLDAVLSLEEHIDPDAAFIRRPRRQDGKDRKEETAARATPYDDLWVLDGKKPVAEPPAKKVPPQPEKDLLRFLADHAYHLDEWQRDIMAMVREEMLYFWPQLQTKIMNEGWAAYWHIRLIRELEIDENETIEFAKMNAGVLQPTPVAINPYLLGLRIYEDLEKRWDATGGQGSGREKIFEVRAMENDISFIRNYLTKELVEDMDLYLFKKNGNQWVVAEKEWEQVRDALVKNMVNCGFPVIMVVDGDYNGGELYLKHQYEGVELDITYLEKTLPNLYLIWGKTINLETVLNDKPVLFSYDGKRNFRKNL